jgi:hypothetical protein
MVVSHPEWRFHKTKKSAATKLESGIVTTYKHEESREAGSWTRRRAEAFNFSCANSSVIS